MIRPYVNIMLTSPSILLLPIYFAVFGISRWAIIVLIIDYSIFFLIVSTTTAIRGVNKEIVEMSKVFGASERQQLRSIYLPSAAPVVFGALRIALGRAIKGMINGELFIAVIGIGARSQGFARRFDMEGVFALAILVVGVALILGFILNLIDGRVNKWVPSIRRNG
jgi:NitT/TauT family transport system permease protein